MAHATEASWDDDVYQYFRQAVDIPSLDKEHRLKRKYSNR